jgi:hypothetical protein
MRGGLSKRVDYAFADIVSVLGDFKVPDAHDRPTGCSKLAVDSAVACDVACDLLVPIGTGASGPVSRWVAVPESSIDENRDFERGPSQVRATCCSSIVAAPASNPEPVEGASDGRLRIGVSLPYRSHDPVALLGCPGVGH